MTPKPSIHDFEERPFPDSCRYVLVVPSPFNTRTNRKYGTDDRSELRSLFEEKDPDGRGWVYDRDTEERLHLEDLS